MRLNVPHGYQPNDYTCGPKSLWMVLRYYKKRVPLSTLVTLCETTVKTGTRRRALERTMRHFGFQVHAKPDAHLNDVQKWIEKGVPVIINFREWDEDISHYAVIVGMTKTQVVLHDPSHGSDIKISHEEFTSRWYGKHHTKFTQWMMVAEPK
ncbi:MAG: cysteine peptidase family C39 domain-containing protein [Patescibacteria group bacterium]